MIEGKRCLNDIFQQLSSPGARLGWGTDMWALTQAQIIAQMKVRLASRLRKHSIITLPALLRRHNFLLLLCIRRKACHSVLLPSHFHHPHVQARHLRPDRPVLGLLRGSRLSECVQLHSGFILLDEIRWCLRRDVPQLRCFQGHATAQYRPGRGRYAPAAAAAAETESASGEEDSSDQHVFCWYFVCSNIVYCWYILIRTGSSSQASYA